jgi:hypothetical protein
MLEATFLSTFIMIGQNRSQPGATRTRCATWSGWRAA